MPIPPFFSRKRSRKPKKKRAGSSGPWGLRWWVLGFCLAVLIGGVGALKWSRTGPGQAVLLSMGSEKMFDDVQGAVGQALSGVLPGFRTGPVGVAETSAVDGPDASGEGDFDWPVPNLGPGAEIRCREVVVPPGRPYWEWQRLIAEAVEGVGARVLWGERLSAEGTRGGSLQPDEESDLLRLDVGVVGRPTHCLVLRRQGTRVSMRWDRGHGQTAWNLLRKHSDKGVVALIVDDFGNARTPATSKILDLPVPVTISVLPGLRYSRHFTLQGTDLVLPPDRAAPSRSPGEGNRDGRALRLAAGCPVELTLVRKSDGLLSRRREVMLHLPMQPQGYPETNPGPDAVMVDMDTRAIGEIVDKALASVPVAAGLNNHMGSAATADEATMTCLMKVLKERGLFFVDSLTSANSRAYSAAVRAGIPALKNRIFLDYDHEDSGRIAANLAALARSARATGFAVGICHPHSATADVLAREVSRLQAEGICFVTVSEMLALQAGS